MADWEDEKAARLCDYAYEKHTLRADAIEYAATALREAASAAEKRGVVKGLGDEAWRCFSCGEVFTDRTAAAEHFGFECEDPACRLNALEGGILALYREAQTELRRYRQEDNEAFRQFYALGSEHHVKTQRAEESGYAKGLADGRALIAAQKE